MMDQFLILMVHTATDVQSVRIFKFYPAFLWPLDLIDRDYSDRLIVR